MEDSLMRVLDIPINGIVPFGGFSVNEKLSGDRVPLLYRPSSFDPDKLPPALIIRDVEVGLPDLIRFLAVTEQSKSLESLVDACVNYIGLDTGFVRPGDLLSLLYRNLSHEDDAEGYVVSSALFAQIQDPRVACLPTKQFLVEIAHRYLDSTSYLVPVLHGFAEDAIAASRRGKTDSMLLFLRDALLFWPSLRALQRGRNPIPLNFLVYTRPLRDRGQSPLLFREYLDGRICFRRSLALGKALILDVGLYGTLIADLYKKGHFSTFNTVFFFGSRNPHIPGFLNHCLATTIQARKSADPLTVVRYVDTVECLLKPFQLPMGTDGEVKIELGDPISLICSAAFMRALGLYSSLGRVRQRKNGTAPKWDLPVPSARSWYLPRPIPAWSKAREFVESWSVEKITPIEQFAEWTRYNGK
jgi:hypothetical protein